ncbi:hypothetical protein WL51_03655 [Burkholderia ubonensis]|uniref:Uncharacterized protein n=2 Tax=Burkholderia cepacia complex TaxID=87882 RepID=A0A1B4PZE5_BURCE|nr:hypothetical protein WT26_25565 [Burkholderia cepacia]AOK26055.1 hypothetical protein WK67_25435 [Burkholderia ubonensis]KWC42243.1 hypothetical protein WL51_03655 [Burkholderia ubonensis]
MRRIRHHPIWALVEPDEPLTLEAAAHVFGAHRPALSTQLPHDSRTAIAATVDRVNGDDLSVQHGIGQ